MYIINTQNHKLKLFVIRNRKLHNVLQINYLIIDTHEGQTSLIRIKIGLFG